MKTDVVLQNYYDWANKVVVDNNYQALLPASLSILLTIKWSTRVGSMAAMKSCNFSHEQ